MVPLYELEPAVSGIYEEQAQPLSSRFRVNQRNPFVEWLTKDKLLQPWRCLEHDLSANMRLT